MAQEIEDNTFFKGQIQQLQFVSNPQAAYELCKQYVPDCTEPLPRPQQDDSMASYRGMTVRDSYDTVEYSDYFRTRTIITRGLYIF